MLDEELEAPPPANRIQTVADLNSRTLTVGDKLILLDTTWNILFPLYQPLPESCICTVFIDKLLLKERYGCGIVDIVTNSGRIITPAGVRAVVTVEQMRTALTETEVIRARTYALPDNSALCPHPERNAKLYYEDLAERLRESGRLVLPIPEADHSDHRRFQARINFALRKRLRITTRILPESHELVVELKKY